MLDTILKKHSISYKNRQLVIDGRVISKKDFKLSTFQDTLDFEEFKKAVDTPDLYDILLEAGKENRDAEKEAAKESSSYLDLVPKIEDKDEEDNRRFISTHALAFDVLTQKTVLYNVETNQEVDQLDRYLNFFSRTEREELKKQTRPKAVLYSHEQIPTTKEVMIGKKKAVYETLNAYSIPKWQAEENKGQELYEDHRRIIETRFSSDSFERFCYCLYHAITTRNHNVVGGIHSLQGSGKSLVYGVIPQMLVGIENTHWPENNILTSSFKDPLMRCRALIFDEMTVHKGAQATALKRITGDRVAINRKGLKEVTIDNTYSIFLTSNNIEDIYVHPEDRRWYLLEDSGFHIKDAYGHEFIENYVKRLTTDNEFVANLGYWILNNFNDNKFKPNEVYKGATFEKACIASIRNEVLQDLAVALEEGVPFTDYVNTDKGDEVTYTDLKADFRKRMKDQGVKYQKFEKPDEVYRFFNNFKLGGERVCQVERTSDDAVLKIRRII